jgi:hypothetical protein
LASNCIPLDDDIFGWKVLHDTTFTIVNLSLDHFITSNNIDPSGVIALDTEDEVQKKLWSYCQFMKTQTGLD